MYAWQAENTNRIFSAWSVCVCAWGSHCIMLFNASATFHPQSYAYFPLFKSFRFIYLKAMKKKCVKKRAKNNIKFKERTNRPTPTYIDCNDNNQWHLCTGKSHVSVYTYVYIYVFSRRTRFIYFKKQSRIEKKKKKKLALCLQPCDCDSIFEQHWWKRSLLSYLLAGWLAVRQSPKERNFSFYNFLSATSFRSVAVMNRVNAKGAPSGPPMNRQHILFDLLHSQHLTRSYEMAVAGIHGSKNDISKNVQKDKPYFYVYQCIWHRKPPRFGLRNSSDLGRNLFWKIVLY